ncbi:TPA: carbohydrate kinase [Escherichia coli]|uniref:glycine-rich domain-containing protein n=1 Tax=Escherichia coli TaxID=562 RepID=UPI000934A0CD|nr:carbohydrate kinase [Escherichia coli]EFA5010021.1 carbohydrate kinase [Escherichia coli]EJM1491755.1 carbohydrate kinase [Escherichia coli]MED8719936.1 carbohydrate kinase [Escherichia coli]HAH0681251.1 carbohydrate kinase [Escherichia coli]HAX4780931.1 carbohydrate kinase [Escherichia coli]
MHRIDTKTAQKDKFGAGKNGFTRGNPQTGTPATDLDDDYFDMLQEELCSVVEASGASLEKERHDQLLTALRALLLSRKNPFGDIKSDGTVKTALENLGLGDGSGRYSKTVVFSSSGSYTWPADVKRIDVILTAGGGGGGGCNAENANQTFSGAGGGAGGTVFATIYATDNDAGPGTYTVTIGSGGSGANGPGSGNNGGHSSFMTLTALGGQGGQWGGATNTAGGRGGSGSGGYKTEQGGDGSDGQAGQALLVGNGASSYWGGGGRAGQLSGNPGVCSGSGGGGAYDNSYSHTSGCGGHGANGVLVIREYM